MKGSIASKIKSLFEISDEQAMWRVQHHDDHAAFAQLVRRWQIPIQRLCHRVLDDAHRAEDVAQETFARLFARRKDYVPSGAFPTFLWRLALNLCYDELRRQKRRPDRPAPGAADGSASNSELEALASSEPIPDLHLARQEQAELVRQALHSLPEIYRTVLILRHYEDLKFREIAEVLGVPEGTVKSRTAEALAMLNARLARDLRSHSQAGRSANKNLSKENLTL